MLRSANARVKVKTTWPHEVVYNKDNSAAEYIKLTMPQFVLGFLTVSTDCPPPEKLLREEVLKEIMIDADKYTWELVRSAHKIFLQQIESGRLHWHDDAGRQAIRSSHVWHAATPSSPVTTTTFKSAEPAKSPARRSPRAQTPYATDRYTDPVMAKDGDQTCSLFNNKHCRDQESHKHLQHACEYCRISRGRICMHPERICNKKYFDQVNLNA
jgi:hypothetical protein